MAKTDEDVARVFRKPAPPLAPWRRSRRAGWRRLLVAGIAIVPSFVAWGFAWAAWGGHSGVNRLDDWYVGYTGLAFGFLYLGLVAWWLDQLVARRGGVVTLLAHAGAAAVLSSPWAIFVTPPDGPAHVVINALAIATVALFAATVRGSFSPKSGQLVAEEGSPAPASTAAAATTGAAGGFRRSPVVTLLRWLVGLGVAGLGFGVAIVAWRAMGSTKYDDDFLFGVPHMLSILAGLYVLLVPWWVDQLLARRGRRRASLVHFVIAAVLALPFTMLGNRGEGVVVYAIAVATSVGAVALAGLIPGSFAPEQPARAGGGAEA